MSDPHIQFSYVLFARNGVEAIANRLGLTLDRHGELVGLDQIGPSTEEEIRAVARNIVNQLADAYEVPVPVRQATNDQHDEFVTGLLRTVASFVLKDALREFVRDGVCLTCGDGVLSNGEHIDPDRHMAETARVRADERASIVQAIEDDITVVEGWPMEEGQTGQHAALRDGMIRALGIARGTDRG